MAAELVFGVAIGAFFQTALVFGAAYFLLGLIRKGPRRALVAAGCALVYFAGSMLVQLAEADWTVPGEAVLPLIIVSAIYTAMVGLWGWRTFESDRRDSAE